jgi:hypothetical protein
MITCLLSNLEARCAERGYTLDEVRACIVSQDGDSITVDETHPAYPKPKPRPQRVTLLEKAKNFTSATVKHVASGMHRCTDEQIAERFAICQGCEHYVDNACAKCGCKVARDKAIISKLAWAEQSCPVGKWGPIAPGV